MRRLLFPVFLLFAGIITVLCGCATYARDAANESAWPLAVRIHSYGKYQDAAWAHLQEIGVKHIFLPVPKPGEADAVIQKLKANGLKAIVLRGDAELSNETFVKDITPQLAVCNKMGVKYMFLSAKRKDVPKATVYARLRAAGDVAKKYGVIIALETHPDLGTNGAVQVETMQAVNHPNIRVNFDTANITYYNKNTSAAAELKKSLPYVATVEFKDHSGDFETWVFPALGQGIVDVSTIAGMLREHGYAGPVTLEFEGTKGVELSEEETKKAIADSVAYARTQGNFK